MRLSLLMFTAGLALRACARPPRRCGDLCEVVGTYRDDVSTSQFLEIAGREVTITNPDKVVFAADGHTKLDLVRYYVAVGDGALRGVAGRPMVLKRFVKGIDEEAFFQKRAPS